jgi:hypothetical protein
MKPLTVPEWVLSLFFKLPLEIRQRILGLLLMPFYDNHSGIRAADLRIHGKHLGNDDEYYEGDFEAHLARQEEDELEEGEQPYIMSAEERQKCELAYYKEKRDFLHEAKLHLGREYQYEMDGFPYKDYWHQGPHRDWLMLDLARNLSNVSTRFSQELGAVFWASTSIRTEFISRQSLVHFLKERPAIHQGVKVLFIGFNFWEDSDLNDTALKSLCEYLSSTLTLQHLGIDIAIDEPDLPFLASGTGGFESLRALQILNVSRSFEIRLCIMCPDRDFGDDIYEAEDAEIEYCSKLEEMHMPALRDLMMPYTLRPAEPKTDKEKYLLFRPIKFAESNG